MSEKGVHYLAYASIKERLAQNALEVDRASEQLQEALKLGDLSENSEYDAAKENMRRVTKERDELLPVLSMSPIRGNDSASIFEEGCVVDLKVYSLTNEPMKPQSEAFRKMVESTHPIFSGTLLFGGTLPVQELLKDSALSADTPIGRALLGKQSGSYSIKVPGGFANITAKKLKSTEFTTEDIGCEYRG